MEFFQLFGSFHHTRGIIRHIRGTRMFSECLSKLKHDFQIFRLHDCLPE
jgi:hypothetical protein